MLEHRCDAGMSSVALCMMCPAERRCIISIVWMLVAVCGSHMMLAYICAAYGDSHDIKFNHAKTVCVYLPSKGNCTLNSPLVYLNSLLLSLVPKFKYLGSLITQDNSDDENMRRQRGSCYARSNGLIKNFYACSPVVKCDLFKAFCCGVIIKMIL